MKTYRDLFIYFNQGIHQGKIKVVWNLKKKLCGFSYSKSMTNFEAYRWIISTNINLLNLKKSDIMCNIHILYKFPIQLYFSKVFSSRKKLRQFFFSKKPFFQNSEMKTTSLFFLTKNCLLSFSSNINFSLHNIFYRMISVYI